MQELDQTDSLQNAVRQAASRRQPLKIVGGDTKSFYGRTIEGDRLNIANHSGVIRYEPTELFITARSGTPLTVIEKLLSRHCQMLPFEPPYFGEEATLGGAVAAGLSGPRRASAGGVRDSVLGVRILNGQGQCLRFGGEVMKNVAGYDVSRLMAGTLGTLGVVLEVSLKLLPRPLRNMTFVQTATATQALELMQAWARQPLPVSATYHEGHELYVRLSGSEHSIQSAARITGGEMLDWNDMFWRNIQEQGHAFFITDLPLWRLSMPSATSVLVLPGEQVMEWNGALRWLVSDADPQRIRNCVESIGGHATLFKNGVRRDAVFHPLPTTLLKLHQQLKFAFDPHGILNPGRMYAEL